MCSRVGSGKKSCVVVKERSHDQFRAVRPTKPRLTSRRYNGTGIAHAEGTAASGDRIWYVLRAVDSWNLWCSSTTLNFLLTGSLDHRLHLSTTPSCRARESSHAEAVTLWRLSRGQAQSPPERLPRNSRLPKSSACSTSRTCTLLLGASEDPEDVLPVRLSAQFPGPLRLSSWWSDQVTLKRQTCPIAARISRSPSSSWPSKADSRGCKTVDSHSIPPRPPWGLTS